MHTIESLGYRIAMTAQSMALTPSDIYLPTSSLSDGMTINAVFATLAFGGQVVVPPNTKDAGELIAILREFRPTVLALVPATLHALLNHPSICPTDFSSLRLIRCSGDWLTRELGHRFQRFAGFPISRAYGITEIGPIAINIAPLPLHIGSVGPPGPGIEVEVRDPNGREVSPRVTGSIWLRSPSRMIGYWERQDLTARAFSADWFRTGDSGYVDEDGYIWLTGRQVGVIIRDGRNVHPSEVEEVLAEHSAIELVAVVGAHSAEHGEEIIAFVTTASPRGTKTESLLRWAKQRLGVIAPAHIVEVSTMPLTLSGKIDRSALRQRYEFDAQ